eukprot:TRINITY_DN1020_c0_g1_i1.p1 TRINITY_DN1020_c0_g1~~TRINITY_DN1020_c0_g1_i1.p1  ORF type:complete len:786 (-),score=191.65 TRINITY_DN1020_c0_g1_i1:1182-3539(-)
MDVSLELFHVYSLPHRPFPPSKITSHYASKKFPNFTSSLCWASKDARILFIGTQKGEVLAYSLGAPSDDQKESLTPSFKLPGHHGRVSQIVWHDRTQLLYTSSWDGTVRVWDPFVAREDRRCIQSIIAHGRRAVNGIGCHMDYLITVGLDSTVRVFEPSKRRKMTTYPWYEEVQVVKRPIEPATGLCIFASSAKRLGESGDVNIGLSSGKLLTFQSTGYAKKRGDTAGKSDSQRKDGETAFELTAVDTTTHSGGVIALLYMEKENLIVTLSHDSSMRIIEGNSQQTLVKHRNESGCLYTCMDWDSDRKELYMGDGNGYVEIWKYDTLETLRRHRVSLYPICDIRCMNEQIYISSMFGCQAFNLIRETVVQRFGGHSDAVVGVFLTERLSVEKKIYSVGLDNLVAGWSIYDTDASSIFQKTFFDSEVTCATSMVDDDVCILFHGTEDGSVIILDVDGDRMCRRKKHKNTVTCLAVGRYRWVEGKRVPFDHIVSVGYDGRLYIWDAHPSEIPHIHDIDFFDVSKTEVLCVLVDHGTDTYITAGNDTSIDMWSIENNGHVGKMVGFTEPVSCMCIEGRLLFSGHSDGSIYVWDLGTQSALFTLKHHTAEVSALVMAPDVGYLMSCSFDGDMVAWDYPKREVVRKISLENEELRCMTYDREFQAVFCGSTTGRVIAMKPFKKKDDEFVDMSESRETVERLMALESDDEDMEDDDGVESNTDIESQSTSRSQRHDLLKRNQSSMSPSAVATPARKVQTPSPIDPSPPMDAEPSALLTTSYRKMLVIDPNA